MSLKQASPSFWWILKIDFFCCFNMLQSACYFSLDMRVLLIKAKKFFINRKSSYLKRSFKKAIKEYRNKISLKDEGNEEHEDTCSQWTSDKFCCKFIAARTSRRWLLSSAEGIWLTVSLTWLTVREPLLRT